MIIPVTVSVLDSDPAGFIINEHTGIGALLFFFIRDCQKHQKKILNVNIYK